MSMNCPHHDDPLWPAFQEFLKGRVGEVELHSPSHERLWEVFKAGAAAEHARIIDIFANNGVVLSAPTPRGPCGMKYHAADCNCEGSGGDR